MRPDPALLFCQGFVTAALLLAAVAIVSACTGPVAKTIPAKERAVLDINLQIDQLSARKAALLKAIAEEREAAAAAAR